jgi:hypothetical protein
MVVRRIVPLFLLFCDFREGVRLFWLVGLWWPLLSRFVHQEKWYHRIACYKRNGVIVSQPIGYGSHFRCRSYSLTVSVLPLNMRLFVVIVILAWRASLASPSHGVGAEFNHFHQLAFDFHQQSFDFHQLALLTFSTTFIDIFTNSRQTLRHFCGLKKQGQK